jgi:hypothetical protein
MTRDCEFTHDDDARSEESPPAAEPASPLLLTGAPAGPDPRLGIIHLLMGTACVAVYLGTEQWLALLPKKRSLLGMLVAPRIEIGGISAGLALAGLILWAVRRQRGRVFPKYPGDVLWIALGLMATLPMITFWALYLFREESRALQETLLLLYVAAMISALVGLFRWGTRRTNVRRWKVLFGLSVVNWAGWTVASAGAVLYHEILLIPLLIAWMLAFAVVMRDLQGRDGDPWTEQLPVALALGAIFCLQAMALSDKGFLPLAPAAWVIAYFVAVIRDLRARIGCPWTHWVPAIIVLLSFVFSLLGWFLPLARLGR